MKFVLKLILWLIASNLLGQNSTYYIFSDPGLWLRKEPSIISEKIEVIPIGTAINNFIGTSSNSMTVNWITDNWVEIKYGSKSGYVFNGFLSTFKYPQIFNGNIGKEGYALSSMLEDYMNFNYKKIGLSDTIIIEKYHQINYIQYYEDSLKLEIHQYYEGQCAILTSKHHNLNDGINLVRILVEKSNEKAASFDKAIYFKDLNGNIYKVLDGGRSDTLYEILFNEKVGLIIKMCFPCC